MFLSYFHSNSCRFLRRKLHHDKKIILPVTSSDWFFSQKNFPVIFIQIFKTKKTNMSYWYDSGTMFHSESKFLRNVSYARKKKSTASTLILVSVSASFGENRAFLLLRKVVPPYGSRWLLQQRDQRSRRAWECTGSSQIYQRPKWRSAGALPPFPIGRYEMIQQVC